MESSVGISINHALAALEATASSHEFILPEHLFIGLCKLEDIVAPGMAQRLRVPTGLIPRLSIEVSQLVRLFKQFKLDLKHTRRALRELLGNGGYQKPDERTAIHRSPESRAAYERAQHIAQRASAPVIAVQHMLAALLEIEDSKINQLLTDQEIDVNALRDAAANLSVVQSVSATDTPCLDGRLLAPRKDTQRQRKKHKGTAMRGHGLA